MTKSNKIIEQTNPQRTLIKYQEKVFDKFLSDLFPLNKESKSNKDSEDPHYFI